ncbi:unnamed protein product [Camellia sinensis]
MIVSMENEWGFMSKQIQLSKDGENFTNSVQLKDDNYQILIINNFTTLSRYTMIAILLDESNIAPAEDYDNNELFKP